MDAKKLEKAQAKLQEKQEKRSKEVKTVHVPKLESATASQASKPIFSYEYLFIFCFSGNQ